MNPQANHSYLHTHPLVHLFDRMNERPLLQLNNEKNACSYCSKGHAYICFMARKRRKSKFHSPISCNKSVD